MNNIQEILEKAREPTALGLTYFYNLIFAENGWALPEHLDHLCQALADTRIERLIITVGPGSGKSQLVSIAYPAWRLGIDPRTTILGISGAEDLIVNFVSSTMEIIEHSPIYREIFPHIKPDKNKGWSPSGGMFLAQRERGNPDANYQAFGVSSKQLTGKHGRELILDDVLTPENSSSPELLQQMFDWYFQQIIGRADPRGARFIVIGRRWEVNDLYERLGQTGDFVTMILPAFSPPGESSRWEIHIPENKNGIPLRCCFTDHLFDEQGNFKQQPHG